MQLCGAVRDFYGSEVTGTAGDLCQHCHQDVRLRMRDSHADQLRVVGKRRARVRRVQPVDQERHRAPVRLVEERKGQPPVQLRAVGTHSRHLCDRAEVQPQRADSCEHLGERPRRASAPRHKGGLRELIHPERARALGRRLGGVGPNDLEVRGTTQTSEFVTSAASGVRATGNNGGAPPIANFGGRRVHVRSCEHEVVDHVDSVVVWEAFKRDSFGVVQLVPS